jgi:hypothetical protein
MTQGESAIDMDLVIEMLKTSDEKAVVVDTRTASSAAITAMKSCANEIMSLDSMSGADYYIIEPATCVINGESKTPEECEAEIENINNVYMVYNREQLQKGYFFYSNKGSMVISGEEDMFQDCDAYFLFY